MTTRPEVELTPKTLKQWVRQSGLRLAITPHSYTLLDSGGSCSCDLILAEGCALASDLSAWIKNMTHQTELQKLSLFWYWSHPPKRLNNRLLLLSEFCEANQKQQLSENLCYQLSCAGADKVLPPQ